MDGQQTGSPDALEAYPPGISREERRVLSAVGDPVALAILSAIDGRERDGHSLVIETRMAQSSIYRKLKELQEERLIYISRLAITADGHKVELYRSRLREIHVEFGQDQARVRVVIREDAADRIHAMWTEVRRSPR